MSRLSFLKSDRSNINTILFIGIIFVVIGILDVLLNTFFKLNLFSFLPGISSNLFPFLISMFGFHLMRIEFTGSKTIDSLNKNINTSTFNAALTLLILFVVIKAIPPSLSWMILDANISGDTKEACTGTGACWTYIKVWFRRFMYGMYPNEQHWRINTAFLLVIGLGTFGFFATEKMKKFLALYYVFIYPVMAFMIIYYLISGGYFGLEWIETGAWGGLSLTFIVSFFCLIFCFPLGMILALGRRSSLPAIRYVSIGYIEFWRGVPLITVLFMSSVMFPMFLPEDFFMDKLVRVIIAITLFEGAYCAEVIRGGLQSLSRGQYDAAKSLGMGYWKMHIFVILPQALKLVIPGICNTFLALVKDTPLIFVVGLAELAGMLALAKTNPEWLGYAMEGYVFAAIIFWIICYAMSKYSYNLEEKYKTEK